MKGGWLDDEMSLRQGRRLFNIILESKRNPEEGRRSQVQICRNYSGMKLASESC